MHGEWKANCFSLNDQEDKVLEHYRQEIAEALVKVMTLREAIETYGDDLLIVGTGTITKKGQRTSE